MIDPADLEMKARALVLALERCDRAIVGAFAFSAIHGNEYDGPTYGVELDALRELLGIGGKE